MRTSYLAFLGFGVLVTGCLGDPADPSLEDTPSALSEFPRADDSFKVKSSDGCGRADFVDHGPGKPGGGDNDDYIVIHDLCPDGHGIKVWAWIDGKLIGSMYNGNGWAGKPVIWDPFQFATDVLPFQVVGIKVCLVDGEADRIASRCHEGQQMSIDG